MTSKITFLTGAGASYGCGLTNPYNPPLGSGLYSSLETYAPQMISQLSEIIGNEDTWDFEKKMHQIWESKRVNGALFNSMIASYFSRFQPIMHGNAFVDLFRNLNDENIDFVYSTLNYDCIAEFAASSIGMKLNYNLQQMPSTQFDILKLHGSCNFLLKGMTGPLGGLSFSVGNSMLDGPIEIVDPRQVPTIIQRRPAGPCLSYYMKNKPTAVGTKTIQAIQKKWREIIDDTELLIIIGTNVNKDDLHIWESVTKTGADIGFVGNENSFSNLKSLNSKSNPTHLGTDFAISISEIMTFLR